MPVTKNERTLKTMYGMQHGNEQTIERKKSSKTFHFDEPRESDEEKII